LKINGIKKEKIREGWLKERKKKRKRKKIKAVGFKRRLLNFDESCRTMQMFKKINETRIYLHFSKSRYEYNVASLDALPFIYLASELFEPAL
jgi:hypothetical protein